MHENKKFTIELEEKNQLHFLDVWINHDEDLELSTYVKPTNSNAYLNFNSTHSDSTKIGLIKTLFQKENYITTNNQTPKKA